MGRQVQLLYSRKSIVMALHLAGLRGMLSRWEKHWTVTELRLGFMLTLTPCYKFRLLVLRFIPGFSSRFCISKLWLAFKFGIGFIFRVKLWLRMRIFSFKTAELYQSWRKNLKSKYFCQMIEDAKGDSCEMWRAIKQVLPGTKKSTVSSIFGNGKWHTENPVSYTHLTLPTSDLV